MPVKVIAGCIASTCGADLGGRRRARRGRACRRCARRAGPARIAPVAASIGDHVGEHVVGDGEQQQVAGAGDGGGLVHVDAREQRLDAGAGGVGLAGDGDDLVARGAEAAARTAPTRPAPTTPIRVIVSSTFRSSPSSGYRTVC